MKLCMVGLLLVLVLWLSSVSRAGSLLASYEPEAREKTLVREIKHLEVNPFKGWLQIINYPIWSSYKRQLASVRFIIYNPWGAITYAFGPYSEQAWRVALCEGGRPVPSTRAHNGQYLGMFQMGDFARHTYGHGRRAIDQARAAYRYFVASGRDWSPWQCKP